MFSPFPGMDPYLEEPRLFFGLRLAMLVAMRAELNASLPNRYAAAIDRYGSNDSPAPWNCFLMVESLREKQPRTIVEVISPLQKKEGPERHFYLERRQQILAKGIKLVEIDLTRSGKPMYPDPMEIPIEMWDCDYRIVETGTLIVTEIPAFDSSRAYLFCPLSVREPLPSITVPLYDHFPGIPAGLRRWDVDLNLQNCFNRAYDEGRYPLLVNYDEPPKPPLNEPDATWARELLAQRETDSD